MLARYAAENLLVKELDDDNIALKVYFCQLLLLFGFGCELNAQAGRRCQRGYDEIKMVLLFFVFAILRGFGI